LIEAVAFGGVQGVITLHKELPFQEVGVINDNEFEGLVRGEVLEGEFEFGLLCERVPVHS
jgi:hypothetical protein